MEHRISVPMEGKIAQGGSLRSTILSVLRFLRLNRLAGRIYYRTVHGFAPAGSALPGAVERAFEIAKSSGVLGAGDYCEFGIYKGYTFLHAQRVAERIGAPGMRFIGFDSFAGLPELEELDLVADRHQPFYTGQFAISLDYVRTQLERRGIDWSRAFLVPGFFRESLASEAVRDLHIERIAIALVDCDLYSSTADVLEFLDSRLIDGAVVIMDDWKSYGDGEERGQPLALREFLERCPHWQCTERFDYGDYGRVFTFHRHD